MDAISSYHCTSTALHERNHVIGVATHWRWSKLIVNSTWQEYNVNKNLQFLSQNPAAKVHGDGQHFWHYGINENGKTRVQKWIIS